MNKHDTLLPRKKGQADYIHLKLSNPWGHYLQETLCHYGSRAQWVSHYARHHEAGHSWGPWALLPQPACPKTPLRSAGPVMPGVGHSPAIPRYWHRPRGLGGKEQPQGGAQISGAQGQAQNKARTGGSPKGGLSLPAQHPQSCSCCHSAASPGHWDADLSPKWNEPMYNVLLGFFLALILCCPWLLNATVLPNTAFS